MIRNGKKKAISCALVAAMSVGLAACGTTSYDFKVSYDGIKTGDVSSKVSVHDPSILKADGEYYIFGSHMSAAKSSDLLNWEKVADGYSKKNPVYGQIYDVADEAFAYSGSKNSLIKTDDKQVHVWAPDVIYNETTGLVIHPEADKANNVDPYYGKRLLGGGHISIEGPYIMYDETSGYYYLFVSYGALTSNGGYQVRVFRSKTVDGEYVDMNGKYPEKSAQHQNFGLKLTGNYKLPSLEKAYMATGHNSAFVDDDGRMYLVYHTRFNDNGEGHSPRVHQMLVNEDGWPCELPYQTQGETVNKDGYDADDIIGRYYVINQGTAVDSKIANPVILYLEKNGKVKGEKSEGTWECKDGSYYMNITIDGKKYSGVFCQMKDEAGSDVMTFSAVGENKSVWGVKYL